MIHLIGAIIIGGIAGGIAKLLMPGKDPGGCVITVILGIVGAVVATYLGRILGLYGPGQSAGFIGAVIGAVIVLFIYRLIVGRRKTL